MYGTCLVCNDRKATRKCFQCSKPLCANCRAVADHHFFCDEGCHRAWIGAERRRRMLRRIAALRAFVVPQVGDVPNFSVPQWRRRINRTILLVVVLQFTLLGYLTIDRARPQRPVVIREGARAIAPSLPGVRWAGEASIDITSATATVTAEVSASGDLGLELNGATVRSWKIEGEHARAVTATVPIEMGFNSFAWRLVTADRRIPERTETRIVTLDAASLTADHRRARVQEKLIALTFDGGAESDQVEAVLDTLRQFDVHTTFFLTGEFIARYPDISRKIVLLGHEVGNHTYTHAHFAPWSPKTGFKLGDGVTRERVQLELLKTERLFETVTGSRMLHYWRAPYGEIVPDVRKWAAELGYVHVGWTAEKSQGLLLDTLDWVADRRDPLYKPGKQVVRELVHAAATKPAMRGGIVLMHLGTERHGDTVAEELPTLIDGLIGEGYTPVRVSHLLTVAGVNSATQ